MRVAVHSVGNRNCLSLSLSRRVSGLSHFVVRMFLAFGIVWFVNPERTEELRNKRKQTKQTYVN